MKYFILALISVSVAMNAHFIVKHLRTVEQTVFNQTTPECYDSLLYGQECARFGFLPPSKCSLLFIGDSIPNQMVADLANKFSEGDLDEIWAKKLKGGYRNRCISGVTSLGIEEMLKKVPLPQAEVVYFWFGINDLSMNRSVSDVEREYNTILKNVRRALPSAHFVLVSVLPVCNSPDKNSTVVALNLFLKSAAASSGFTFVNVTSAVTDAYGNREHNSTYDGVHPTAAAFTRIEKILADAQ